MVLDSPSDVVTAQTSDAPLLGAPVDFAGLNTLSKSARLGPVQVKWVRDLGCLFRVMDAERRRT